MASIFDKYGITPISFTPRSPYAGMTEAEADLLQSQRTVEQLSRGSEALGIEDIQGVGDRGFLEGALDYLTLPQRAILGALSGQGGPASGSDIIGAASEDAGIPERAARLAAGFGLDVLTDPLTYLTFGRGGALRGYKGARVAETDVKRAAREVLAPETIRVDAPEPITLASVTDTAGETALSRAGLIRGDVTPLGSNAPSTMLNKPGPQEALSTRPGLVEPTRVEVASPMAQTTPSTVALAEPVTTPSPRFSEDFFTRIGEAAGGGMMFRGGRGVRENIENTLKEVISDPEELRRTTNLILNRTRSEVRGGVGVRIPFIGRDAAGNIVPAGKSVTRRVADLTPGSGRLLDDAGFRGVAEATRGIFNNYRSTGFYNKWSKLMNGRFGAEYADAIRNATKLDPTNANSALNYKTLKNFTESYDDRTSKAFFNNKNAHFVLKAVQSSIDNADDSGKAAKSMEDYYDMADDMVLREGADSSELAGFEAAKSLRDYGESLFDELIESGKRAGVNINRTEARNFVSRVLSPEEAKLRRKNGQKTGVGIYDPTKPSKIGFDTDSIGRLERASNKEMNRRFVEEMKLRDSGHRHFETDPLKIASHQYAAYTQLLTDLNIIGDLKQTGNFIQAQGENLRLLNLPQLIKRGDKFTTEINIIANRLAEASQNAIATGNNAQAIKINDALTKLVTDKNAMTLILAGLADTRPENLKVIGEMTALMKSALATGEKVGIELTKSEKERLFGGASKLVKMKDIITNKEDLIGLELIGASPNTRIPAGLTNTYAHVTVRDAVERLFKIENNSDSLVKQYIDEVFQPIYTLWKTYATVGRPGGYHIRNIIGGVLNNYLGDVSFTDTQLSGSILTTVKLEHDRALRAIENIRQGKASGLSGDNEKLAQYIINLSNKRGGVPFVELEAEQLADILIYNKLSKIKVGPTNAADVLTSARNRGVFQQNRRLEYMRDQAMSEGEELAQALRDPDFINLFPGRSTSDLNGLQTLMNKSANLGYIRASGKVSDVSENFLRLSSFISGARRFGLEDEGFAASYLTKALQFDYADLSEFERKYMKVIMPFYVWSRNNLPLQFFSLFNQPGKFNRLANAKENLQTQFGAYGDNEEMANMVPSWMRERMGFVSQFTFRDNPIMLGIESPALDLNRYLSFGVGLDSLGRSGEEVISASNPFFKAMVEGITNTDLYGRRQFSDKGVASPFGELPVPGSFLNAEGERVVDEKTYSIIKDVVPPLGVIARLSGVGGEGDRQLSNFLSTVGGLPVGTLTPTQSTGELKAREERMRKKLISTADSLGVDKEWLSGMISSGASVEDIRFQIASGFGRL